MQILKKPAWRVVPETAVDHPIRGRFIEVFGRFYKTAAVVYLAVFYAKAADTPVAIKPVAKRLTRQFIASGTDAKEYALEQRRNCSADILRRNGIGQLVLHRPETGAVCSKGVIPGHFLRLCTLRNLL